MNTNTPKKIRYTSAITSKGNISYSYLSQEHAEHLARKLDDCDCDDYVDCINCDSCISCIHCDDCINCIDCTNVII